MKILFLLMLFGTAAAVYFHSRTKSPSSDDSVSRANSSLSENGWKRIWELRRAALERTFGQAEDSILTALPPFYLGGSADVLTFRRHNDGVVYVTAALIGDDQARPNSFGQYELMICTKRDSARKDSDWAPQLISKLARYTVDAVLSPNDTMDIGPALPSPTKLTSFLYLPYANLNVDGKSAAVMLCLGITADELAFIQDHNVEELLSKMKHARVYPFTDLDRNSVLEHEIQPQPDAPARDFSNDEQTTK